MDFRILGPLEVIGGSGPIPLGGPKQRAVLAHLLIRPNQIVPADTLIDQVWGEEPPPRARASLHSYVSHLRSALGDGRLEGVRPGYRLRIEPGEMDAQRVRALLDEARQAVSDDPGRARRACETALGEWRGPAFADLLDEDSLRAEIERLDELRLATTEELLDARLALGDHGEVATEIPALLERHPLRERLWGQLMLARYRAGRPAEALETFARARSMLADELGVDPSPELQDLHRRILRHDDQLAAPGPLFKVAATLDRRGLTRARTMITVVLVLCLVGAALGSVAVNRAHQAAREEALGRARALAVGSTRAARSNSAQALRLALRAEAVTRRAGLATPSFVIEALHRAIRACRVVARLPDLARPVLGGGLVAAVAADGSVAVIDPTAHEEVARLPTDATAVAFAPDGSVLATAEQDGTRLWRVEDGTLIGEIPDGLPVVAVAYDPTGGRLATADQAGGVRVLDVEDGRTVTSLTTNGTAIALDPGGTRIAVASDHEIRIWHVRPRPGPPTRIRGRFVGRDVTFSPDGRWIVGTGIDVVTVWDVRTGTEVRRLEGHVGIVEGVDASADGATFVTGGDDGTVRVWDRRGARELTLGDVGGAVEHVAIDPTGRWVAAAGRFGPTVVWDVSPTGSYEVLAVRAGTGWMYGVDYSPDGRRVVVGTDGGAAIVDLGTGGVTRLEGHEGPVFDSVFDPSGALVATAGWDGTVRLWTSSGAPIAVLTGHSAPVWGLAFHPDGERLVSVSEDGTLRVWDPGTRRELAELNGHGAPIWNVAISPDGDLAATVGDDDTARTWSLADRALRNVFEGHRNNVIEVAFDPAGELLGTASLDASARIWDVESGRLVRVLRGHAGPVSDIDFT
ncbi:MAG: BTAD domain-containing putative transcriptional regulator, partial [Candidatus Velamenicoccus archaeovorus]